MDNNTSVLNLADNGLVIETMTKSADELLKDGYIKLDKKYYGQFSPVIKLLEELGLQKWAASSSAKEVEKILGGSYRCIVDGKVLESDVLANAKDSLLKRGFILGKDGITKQAAWEKINPKEIANTLGKAPAPNVVAIIFQVLAIATSQYYMHEMNNNFLSICSEIKSIKEQFMIQDASEIIAGHKALTSMTNHFDSIMESENRRHSESITTGRIEFDALKQIERCKLKLEKNYPLNPKKDSIEKADNNVAGIINTLAQLKMSIYVYGVAKCLKVCFDEINSKEEVDLFIDEINEQIELFKATVNKYAEALKNYVSASKALNKLSWTQIGQLVAVGVFVGPLEPHATGGIEAAMVADMTEKRNAHKNTIEERIKENVTLNGVDSLSSSIVFLEDYAFSLDSKLEIVSRDNEYFIYPIKRAKSIS